jgi:hypothetical protein
MYGLNLPWAISNNFLPPWLIIILIGSALLAYIWITMRLLSPVILAIMNKIKRIFENIGY